MKKEKVEKIEKIIKDTKYFGMVSQYEIATDWAKRIAEAIASQITIDEEKVEKLSINAADLQCNTDVCGQCLTGCKAKYIEIDDLKKADIWKIEEE